MTREELNVDSVWRQALVQCDFQPLKALNPDFQGLPGALRMLTERDFQPLLALRFQAYLELLPLLVEWAGADMEPLEAFVSGLLRQQAFPAFLYGVFGLRAVLTQESDSSRMGFSVQIKAELLKAAACCRGGSEAETQSRDSALRYSLMLLASLKPHESHQFLEDLALRREYLPLSILTEYLPVSNSTFQKLLAGVSQASPCELYTTLHRAVLLNGKDLLPADLLKVAPAWVAMVGKLWRLHQGRGLPSQQIPSLVSYLRIRDLLPQDQSIKDQEAKAVVAALALIGASLPLPSVPMWVELASVLPGLGRVEGVQRLIGAIGKLVAGLLACSNESVHIAALKGLKEFMETVGEGVNLAGLIPESAVPEAMEFFETCKIGTETTLEAAIPLLRKYVPEPRHSLQIPWRDVASSVRLLQTAVGLAPLPVLSTERIQPETVRALEDIRRVLANQT